MTLGLVAATRPRREVRAAAAHSLPVGSYYHVQRPSTYRYPPKPTTSVAPRTSSTPILRAKQASWSLLSPQPKIAPQPDLTLSSALSGTPVIAAMLKGLTPRGLVLRCSPHLMVFYILSSFLACLRVPYPFEPLPANSHGLGYCKGVRLCVPCVSVCVPAPAGVMRCLFTGSSTAGPERSVETRACFCLWRPDRRAHHTQCTRSKYLTLWGRTKSDCSAAFSTPWMMSPSPMGRRASCTGRPQIPGMGIVSLSRSACGKTGVTLRKPSTRRRCYSSSASRSIRTSSISFTSSMAWPVATRPCSSWS